MIQDMSWNDGWLEDKIASTYSFLRDRQALTPLHSSSKIREGWGNLRPIERYLQRLLQVYS